MCGTARRIAAGRGLPALPEIRVMTNRNHPVSFWAEFHLNPCQVHFVGSSFTSTDSSTLRTARPSFLCGSQAERLPVCRTQTCTQAGSRLGSLHYEKRV